MPQTEVKKDTVKVKINKLSRSLLLLGKMPGGILKRIK